MANSTSREQLEFNAAAYRLLQAAFAPVSKRLAVKAGKLASDAEREAVQADGA